MSAQSDRPILELRKLSRHFTVGSNPLAPPRIIRAVESLDLRMEAGTALGLVGESGSGKTTLGRLILRMIEPSSGRIIFNGEDISSLGFAGMRRLRKDMQIVPQQTGTVLDPLMTVAELLAEPLRIHAVVRRPGLDAEVRRLISLVGLSADDLGRLPDKLSGGQRQRILIARALAVKPRLIILDEPVSALDVSVQGQILNLLSDLRKEFGLSYLFISHDIRVVRHICDEIAIMQNGRIVERGSSTEIFKTPRHSYTRQLLDSML